jgi:F0F1-type ATP synthase assembly protein I
MLVSGMRKLMILVGTTVGSAVGWWLGRFVGIETAFMVSMVGTGVGMYAGIKIAQRYE